MKTTLKNFLAAVSLILMLFIGASAVQVYATTHTLQFVQTPTITLYASISASATSARVTPYPKDLNGVKLTMTDFGSSPTFTIDPKVKNVEEILGFTGITDNGDNTATLTGLTRNLTSKYPYTTTGTGRSHSASAIVVFSNNPQMYNRLAAPENDQTWSGIQTFSSTTQPVYDGTPTFSNPLALINKAYADALSIVGAPTSTFSGMGVSWLATRTQTAAGTASSTTGAPLVIPNKNASSTYNGSTVFNGLLPALRSTFDIDPNFIATSSSNTYNWAGLHSFSATTTFATSTVASSTIGSLNINNASTTSFRVANLASTTNLIISGTCTKGNGIGCNTITIVTGSTGALGTTNSAVTSYTATCSGSQLVVGGGGLFAGGQPEWLSASYPSATNQWTAIYTAGTTGGGSGGTAGAYAICINP